MENIAENNIISNIQWALCSELVTVSIFANAENAIAVINMFDERDHVPLFSSPLKLKYNYKIVKPKKYLLNEIF